MLLVQCLWMDLKLSTSKTPLRSTSGKWYQKPHFAPPAWISALKKSEAESVPFLSCYPTIMWLGHNAGVWERKGLKSLGLWSSCADWQSLTTLAAMLEESPPQVFTQILYCSHHPAVSWQKQASLCPRAEVQCPPTGGWWRQVCGKLCGVFLYKTSWDEHPEQWPPALLGETDLWQGVGNRDLGTCETTPWTGSGNENQSHDIS